MRDKVRSNFDRLTQSSYLDAVSETIRAVQGGSTDQDMADAWGTSSGTVLNARNRNNALGAVALLKLAAEFGHSALDPVMALIGARLVADGEVTIDVSAVPCDVAGTVPLLIELLRDGECSDADVRSLDGAGAIDCFVRIAEFLRERRTALSIRSVG